MTRIMIFGIWMATISMRKPVQMMVVLQLLNQMMQVVAILTLGHTRAVPHDTRECDASCSDGESDSDSDSAGDKRSWEQTNDINCNNRNVVDGGGETSGDDSSPNKADNDPAGTYTEFTAWGNNADDVDRAWCAHEYTLTVDADGPQGNGDGFVVVHEGSVVATESPDGSDSVGQNVWVDGSNSGTDYILAVSVQAVREIRQHVSNT